MSPQLIFFFAWLSDHPLCEEIDLDDLLPASGTHIINAQIFVCLLPLFNDQKNVLPPPENQNKCYAPHQECAACIIQYWILMLLPNCPPPFIFSFNRNYPHCWVNMYVTPHTTPIWKIANFPLPQNLMCQIVNSPPQVSEPWKYPLFLGKVNTSAHSWIF